MNRSMNHSVNFVGRIAGRLAMGLTALTLLAGSAQAADATSPSTTSSVTSATTAADEGVVNLNKATVKQLGFLPGIGPSKAARIIAYRERYAFKKTIELARVKGIGVKTAKRLKRWITVSGPTTLGAPIGTRTGKTKGKKGKKGSARQANR